MDDYRCRHRTWVMQSMPTMSTHEWSLYEAWVAGFGAMRLDQAARNSRKIRRQLRAAKKTGPVTATVANQYEHQTDAMAYLATRHTRMRFDAFIKAVRAAGAAKPGRATRQT